MEESVQTFEPLRTEIHHAPESGLALASLPAGIVRLREAGHEARKALILAGLLGVVSLAILAVFLLVPGGDALVVWQEGDERVLVEGP